MSSHAVVFATAAVARRGAQSAYVNEVEVQAMLSGHGALAAAPTTDSRGNQENDQQALTSATGLCP